MTATAPAMLAETTAAFLRLHAPFSDMEAEALAYLSERAALVFMPRDSLILAPEMGPPRHFYIVQRGKVLARQAASLTVTEYTSLNLAPGECFPIGALSAHRPATNVYTAVEDSYLLQISAAEFLHLMALSPSFHLFCTQYIASLLSQSREQLATTFAQRAAEQQSMTTPLAQILSRAPLAVTPETSTRAALERMEEARVGCMVVTDTAQRPIGILTRSDLPGRIILPGFDLARPIAEVMSSDPEQLPAHASAYDAALAMATRSIRHLLVVDTEGRLLGVVSERDLFSLQRISMRQIRAGIDGAQDIQGLQQAGRDIRQLALNLIAQGVGAEQLTQFICALNDALTRRIIELALARHELREAALCWLAFGSEGRHEQTLSSDQDNGIIFGVPPGHDAEALRARLLACAKEINADLAACGFPLCKGNIMASNPELCLTFEEWQGRFDAWIRSPDPQALLNATIFFDFRVLYGRAEIGDRLRHWLNRNARDNPAFLRMMASNALEVAPPLGRIRDFVLEADGRIDLKKSGARLFVDAARIFALRADVASSSTVQRLRESARKLGANQEEIAAIIDGFHFIQLLRLRAQHLDTTHDEPGDNRIDPDQLNELDRRILKEAFRQARKLQLRLKLDYQL